MCVHPSSGDRSLGTNTLPERSISEDLLQFTVKFRIYLAFSLSKLGSIHNI